MILDNGIYCIIHQQVLYARKYLKIISNEMSVVIIVMKFINAKCVNKREFKQLLEEIEWQYTPV